MIYFIQAGKNGPIKIGFTQNSINDRLNSLQNATYEELELIGTCNGEIEDEKKIHSIFNSIKIRGEWFRPTEDLLNFIFEKTKFPIDKDYEIPKNGIKLNDILNEIERNYIKKALILTNQNISKTAKLLGISFRSMRYRVKKFNFK